MAEELHKLNIPIPPERVFKYRSNRMAPAQQVMQAEQAMFVFERMEYPESGGQYAYFEGVPFPAKGHPFPEAIYAVNAAKRVTQLGLRFLASLHKGKRIERLLTMYVEICKMFLPPYILHERYYSPCALEVMIFIKNFLSHLGINEELARAVAETFATQIEYDNAYRLRIEDTLSETTKEWMLQNPRREIQKLLAIVALREPGKNNTEKFAAVAKIVRLALWLPKFRKSFAHALKESEFERFQLDEADRYHVLLWRDYDFLGLPLVDRIKKYELIHKDGLPKRIIYKPQ